jgi:hypothetical protein
MSNLTLTVSYDGADAEIIQALSRMVAAFPASNRSNGQTSGGSGSGWPEKAAPRFAGYVSHAATRGERSQQAVMHLWLKRDGAVELDDLVKASGVAKSHDFAGVSSSLTRNMLKAGGPKKWYQEHRDVNGKRMRRISDELVQPLKRAFNI